MNRQGDLFEHEGPGPSEENSTTLAYRPDLDKVRAKLQQILAQARAATAMPWSADRLLVYRTIFPRMTYWLPEEEGTGLRFDFETELARLQAA